jgi:hypothetical protein
MKGPPEVYPAAQPGSKFIAYEVLTKFGWQVHITDADGQQYGPGKFDDLLRFDLKHPIKF